jgi:hypothetical protein
MSYDTTKPAASSPAASAEIRAKFEALRANLGGVNLLADPTFLIWAAGDAAAPTHWRTTGTGVTPARIGTGLADTDRKVGKYACKITAGAATATLEQDVLTSTSYDDWLDGLECGFGCWIKTSAGSAGRIAVDDGYSTNDYSSYHTGGGGWEWLTVGSVINASATRLRAIIEVAASQIVKISGPTLFLGETPPKQFAPCPIAAGSLHFPQGGTITTGTDKSRFLFGRPAIVRDVQLHLKTVNTGAALIVDVNHWDGSAMQSMYSTRPQIAASASPPAANAVPDGTYRYRCFGAVQGSTITDALISVDTDQVGSTIAGADLSVEVRILQYMRALEAFLGYNEIN